MDRGIATGSSICFSNCIEGNRPHVCVFGGFINVCLCVCGAVYLQKDKASPRIILSLCSLCYSVNVWKEGGWGMMKY